MQPVSAQSGLNWPYEACLAAAAAAHCTAASWCKQCRLKELEVLHCSVFLLFVSQYVKNYPVYLPQMRYELVHQREWCGRDMGHRSQAASHTRGTQRQHNTAPSSQHPSEQVWEQLCSCLEQHCNRWQACVKESKRKKLLRVPRHMLDSLLQCYLDRNRKPAPLAKPYCFMDYCNRHYGYIITQVAKRTLCNNSFYINFAAKEQKSAPLAPIQAHTTPD